MTGVGWSRERWWSPRRRDRPDLKTNSTRRLRCTTWFAYFGHNDSPSHRRALPMYSIGIAKGNSVSQSAVGMSGVGCQRWSCQASDCLVQPSRPRTNQTMTSNANPRQQRSDEIEWASFECNNRSLDFRRRLAARTTAFTEPEPVNYPFPKTPQVRLRCNALLSGVFLLMLASIDLALDKMIVE